MTDCSRSTCDMKAVLMTVVHSYDIDAFSTNSRLLALEVTVYKSARRLYTTISRTVICNTKSYANHNFTRSCMCVLFTVSQGGSLRGQSHNTRDFISGTSRVTTLNNAVCMGLGYCAAYATLSPASRQTTSSHFDSVHRTLLVRI